MKIPSKAVLIILLKATVSICILIFLANTVNWDRIHNLNSTTLLALCICVFITLCLMLFMALRWFLLIRMQTIQSLSIFSAYKGYLIGLFFNIFMPGAIGGDLVRIKYCRDRCNLSLKKSGLIIITERLFGLTALSLFFIVGLFENYKILSHVKLDLTIVILVMLILISIIIAAKYWISRRIFINNKKFLALILFSLLGQSSDIIAVALFAWTFGYTLNFSQLFFIMPLVYIATVIPISLGGLGVREGVLTGMLSLYGVLTSDAIFIAFMLYLTKATIGIAFGLPLFLKERLLLTKLNSDLT